MGIYETISSPEKFKDVFVKNRANIVENMTKQLIDLKSAEKDYNWRGDYDGMRYKFSEIHNAPSSVVGRRYWRWRRHGSSVHVRKEDIEKLVEENSKFLDSVFDKVVEQIQDKDKYEDLVITGNCNEKEVECIIKYANDILMKDTNEEIRPKREGRIYKRKIDSDKPDEKEYVIEAGKKGYRFNRAAIMHHIYLDDLVDEGIDA